MSTERRLAVSLLTTALGLSWLLGDPRLALAQPPEPLGAEFRVNTTTLGSQTSPAVATTPGRGFVVVWADFEQRGNPEISGQRYDTGGNPLGDEFQVNTSMTSFQFAPAIAADAAGNFVVVWRTWHLGYERIFGRRFAANGQPLTGEFEVADGTTSYYDSSLGVGSAADGRFVVVWHGFDPDSSYGVKAQRLDSSGNPLGGELQVNSYTKYRQYWPAVGADVDGNFVVSWTSQSQDGNYNGVFGQRFGAEGQRIGEEFRINSYTTGWQEHSAISVDAQGDFVVAWHSHFLVGNVADIYGQRFDAQGSPLGDEFRINALTAGDQRYPAVDFTGNGSFVATWRGAGNPSRDVFGREFDAFGTPHGGDFQVNSYTTGYQGQARVAGDEQGRFVVTWTSEDQDGNGYGIFGQRFAGAEAGPQLSLSGACPGPVTATVSNAPPGTEVGLVAAANTNGFVKGGQLCPGTELEVGEPFALPVRWVIVDGNGTGQAQLSLPANRCWVEALALAGCSTSGAVRAPSGE